MEPQTLAVLYVKNTFIDFAKIDCEDNESAQEMLQQWNNSSIARPRRASEPCVRLSWKDDTVLAYDICATTDAKKDCIDTKQHICIDTKQPSAAPKQHICNLQGKPSIQSATNAADVESEQARRGRRYCSPRKHGSFGTHSTEVDSAEEDSLISESPLCWQNPWDSPRQQRNQDYAPWRLQRQEKNRTRPCKGQRDRYKKFLAKVLEQIDQDPQSFDFYSVELPPSLAESNTKVTKLRQEVLRYREKKLRELW